ncbi:hypothetical protein YTPLAS73_09050 [Nitrosarchaeum sp.]|nr:hypothetical protein YTPLAS73_09050 [Nitrosarchaeum sp.]
MYLITYVWSILVIVCLFTAPSLIHTNNTFGDKYDTVSIASDLIHGDPVVCGIEPLHDERFPNLTEEMFEITEAGLNKWETTLKEKTGNIQKWNIYFNPIYNTNPLAVDYEEICDVLISYEAFNDKLVVEGEYFIVKGSKIPIIIIYYLHVDYSLVNNKLVTSYTEKKATSKDIHFTIMHEFGHALGLDHYFVEDVDDLRKIVAGEMNSPSIMISYSDQVTTDEITSIDIEKVLTIYGEDGFGSRENIPKWINYNLHQIEEEQKEVYLMIINHLIEYGFIEIKNINSTEYDFDYFPSWLKNNFNWWNNKLISNEEFFNSISWMINENIIKTN